MRWSKIKNIIILLLAAVNILLLVVVGMRTVKTIQLDRETRERMVEVLERSGVEFMPEKLPGGMELTALGLELSQPAQEQASLIVGEITESGHTGIAASYAGERGGVTFVGNTVDARLLPGAFPLEGKDASQSGAALLSSLGLKFTETRHRQLGSGVELTYTQLWGEIPIPDMSLTLTYTDGSLRRISGRWLLGQEVPAQVQQPCIDGPTALARFLEARNREGYVCSQIRAMYPGYVLVQEEKSFLCPAWFLETDTWPWRFAVDSWTGEVEAAH